MEPYIIRIASQKGGVGKTTVSTNIAVCLKDFGYSVLLVDCDTTNPSIGFHLGMEKSNMGYKQLVKGTSKLSELCSVHAPTGINVIPGAINSKPFIITEVEARRVIKNLKASNYDFVILDTQPGYYIQTAVNEIDETLLITTPDMPSCSSILRSVKLLDEQNAKHNLLINRVKGKKYEISKREIEETYEGKIIGALPESDIVPESIAEHIPAYALSRDDKFSKGVFLSSRFYKKSTSTGEFSSTKRSFWSRLFGRR